LKTTTLARLVSAVTGVGAVVAIASGLSGHVALAVVVLVIVAALVGMLLRPTMGSTTGHRLAVLRLMWSIAHADGNRHAPQGVSRAEALPTGSLLVIVDYAVAAIRRSEAEGWLRAALAVPAGATFEVRWVTGRSAEVTAEDSRRA
jgi:hypothetical protein